VSMPMPGLSQAAYVDFEYEKGVVVHRALTLAIMGLMSPDGQWLFYQTYGLKHAVLDKSMNLLLESY